MYKKLLLAAMGLLATAAASAYSFEEDGIF